MSKKEIESVQKEFPDLSESTIGDVFRTNKNDKRAAVNALRGIEEQDKKDKERKIGELQEMFPAIPRQGIQAILEENNWDIESAIVPLFNFMEQKGKEKEKEERKKRENKERKKRELEAKKASENLMEVFYTLPKDLIQKVLDENEGDIEDTTNQLLSIVAKREAENEAKVSKEQERKRIEQQENQLRELKIQSLEKKFEDLSEGEVIAALDNNGWDIKKAHVQLLKLSTENKCQHLKSLFQFAKMEDIRLTLEANNWDQKKAAEDLSSKRQSPVIIKKVGQSIFDCADQVGQQMEDEITASHAMFTQALKQEAQAQFRQDLEHIIETQVRNGDAPGMNPSSVKNINVILGKPSPIDEELKESEVKEKENPVKVIFTDSQNSSPPSSKFSVTLNVSPQIVDVGDNITVEWECTSGETTNYDWIGLYQIGQPNKQYYTYQWRGRNDTTKGTLTFTAPKAYGEYELRYFYYGSYEYTTRSDSVSVGPRFELEAVQSDSKDKTIVKWKQLSGHPYSRTWIGLYPKAQKENKRYTTYEYATGSEVIFDTPIKPQEYEFRIFTNSYSDHARSNSFKIDGEDKISASLENGVITVSVDIVSVDPSYDSAWLGVFFTSEMDNRQWRRYKYFGQRRGNIQFKAPRTAGEYEVRLFALNNYEPLLISNKFNNPGQP